MLYLGPGPPSLLHWTRADSLQPYAGDTLSTLLAGTSYLLHERVAYRSEVGSILFAGSGFGPDPDTVLYAFQIRDWSDLFYKKIVGTSKEIPPVLFPPPRKMIENISLPVKCIATSWNRPCWPHFLCESINLFCIIILFMCRLLTL